MFKKYLFLSFLVFTNLYSMEDNSNLNEKTALLHSKFKEIKVNKNVNKNKKTLLTLLPRDIWLFILSFLDYKDNRKAFINFFGPIIGADDLNAKKIAIDIYRSAILNSRHLDHWKKITKNVCKSWKNKESLERVENYLHTLNESSNLNSKHNFDINADNLNSILEILGIKKNLLLNRDYESFIIKNRLSSFKILTSFVCCVLLILGIITYLSIKDMHSFIYIMILVWGFSIGSVSLLICFLCIPICCRYNTQTIKYEVSLENRFHDLETKIKKDKIDIFESDNYFLELLDHKFDQGHDILEFEDIDLKSNGKDEDFSIA